MLGSPLTKVILRAFLALLAIWVLGKFSAPFVQLRRVKMETIPLQAEKLRLHRENRLLQEKMQEMRTPQGLRKEAHRQGWIEPGERRIVFLEPPPPQDQQAQPERKTPSLFSRLRAWARAKAFALARPKE